MNVFLGFVIGLLAGGFVGFCVTAAALALSDEDCWLDEESDRLMLHLEREGAVRERLHE